MDGRICSIFSGLHFIMRSVLSTKGRELTGEGADLQWESHKPIKRSIIKIDYTGYKKGNGMSNDTIIHSNTLLFSVSSGYLYFSFLLGN